MDARQGAISHVARFRVEKLSSTRSSHDGPHRRLLGPSRGRCLVARAPLSRGDVALEDAPAATAADESGLLVRCFSSTEARRVVDGLCTLDGEALAPEARSELRAHVAEAATTLEFGAMASDDGDDAPGDDDDEFDDGDGGGWAWRAALRLECNTFTRWSARYEREELGVFPRATRLNHSCDPNLVREQAPPADGAPRFALRFTALRDIAAGEELCFSYVPVTLARAPRRDLLRRHFGFDCACARCREGDDAAAAGARARARPPVRRFVNAPGGARSAARGRPTRPRRTAPAPTRARS